MVVYLVVLVYDISVGWIGFDLMIFDIFVICFDDVVSSYYFVLYIGGLNWKRLWENFKFCLFLYVYVYLIFI